MNLGIVSAISDSVFACFTSCNVQLSTPVILNMFCQSQMRIAGSMHWFLVYSYREVTFTVCYTYSVCSGYWPSSLGESSLQPEQRADSLHLSSGEAISSSSLGV